MTQEEFDAQLEVLTDTNIEYYIDGISKSSKEMQAKVKYCIKASLLIFQMSQEKCNVDNWEQCVAKYILGIEDVKEDK